MLPPWPLTQMCPVAWTRRPRVRTACARYSTADGTTLVARARTAMSDQPACRVPSLRVESSVKHEHAHWSKAFGGSGGGGGDGGDGEGGGCGGGACAAAGAQRLRRGR